MLIDPIELERARLRTRRHFLKQTGALGIGSLALATLLNPQSAIGNSQSPSNPLAPQPARAMAKAKRVIFLHMSGGPPHLDLWDYKPELVKWNDKACPDEFLKGKRFAFTSGVPKLMGTPRSFAQYGNGGIWMSDAIPHFHSVEDELCV